MRCVVVDQVTGRVVNIVMASPSDRAPNGHWLVAEPTDLSAPVTRYEYTPETGFVPDAAYQAELDAEAAALEQEGLDFA